MTVSVVFAIAGVIALLFGIVGGGIKAKEIEVPVLSAKVRIITTIVGIILITITVWQERNTNIVSSVTKNTQIAPTLFNTTSEKQMTTNTPIPFTSTPFPTSTFTSVTTSTADSTSVLENQDLERLYSKLYEAKTWRLVYKDSFEDNAANWVMQNIDNEHETKTSEISDGVLQWGLTRKVEGSRCYYWTAPFYEYSDFYYSINIRRIGESENKYEARWGLIFRKAGSEYYSFTIHDTQLYSAEISTQDDWIDIIGDTRTILVDSGEFNELIIIAEGSDLYYYINGIPVGFTSDSTYNSGNVGFIACLRGNYKPGNEIFFEFDNFELRQKE